MSYQTNGINQKQFIMSTRSTITVRTGKNERKSIYCHNDGYPSGVGAMLLEHYNYQKKNEMLVSFGDMSSLKKFVCPFTENHSFGAAEEDVCVFYGRDRGETNVEATVLKNSDIVEGQEWNYYFDGKEWFVSSGDYRKSMPEREKLTKEICEQF